MAEINIDWKKCINCGACTAVCATGALRLEGKDCTLVYNESRCESCDRCARACPLRAIKAGPAARVLYA